MTFTKSEKGIRHVGGHRYGSLLAIGCTTDGIGKEFVNSLRSEQDQSIRVFNTSPEAMDVTDANAVEKFIASNIDQFGPIEYVFYAAGLKHLGFIVDTKPEDIAETFAVNVFGFINVMRALGRHQSGGRICVITSETAVTPMRATVDYCASKAALEMAIKVAAREFSQSFHITGIRPTAVNDTHMTNDDIPNIARIRGWNVTETAASFKANPIGRMVEKNEIAELARWLLFHAPDSMTGSIVDMRGGN